MKNTIYNILCFLFGVGMIVFGANKLKNFLPMPENMSPEQLKMMEAFNTITWLMPLVGIVEILGGILVAIPKTRALGAITILPVIVGILVHDFTYEPSAVPIALFFALIDFWVIFENRDKYTQFFN